MSLFGPSEENPLTDIINPYMREVKMHPKELSLKDGELQIKDVQVSKGEGSLEARMEALEQEVFKYKKMAERDVDIIHRINQELVTKYKKETTELWKDIFSLHETTNQLQARLYDLQNQNCEYEARFKQMSAAASFRILETKTSFFKGGPLPWKYDIDEDSPPPKE
jgi:predicted RNase H-like nuclease (RuvC/YqgF family)